MIAFNGLEGWQFDLVVLPFVVIFIVICAVIFANQQRRNKR
jgi:hypothetical protein